MFLRRNERRGVIKATPRKRLTFKAVKYTHDTHVLYLGGIAYGVRWGMPHGGRGRETERRVWWSGLKISGRRAPGRLAPAAARARAARRRRAPRRFAPLRYFRGCGKCGQARRRAFSRRTLIKGSILSHTVHTPVARQHTHTHTHAHTQTHTHTHARTHTHRAGYAPRSMDPTHVHALP